MPVTVTGSGTALTRTVTGSGTALSAVTQTLNGADDDGEVTVTVTLLHSEEVCRVFGRALFTRRIGG